MEGWLGNVTVVNRVKRPLTITYDGKTITLPPLGKAMVPPIVADKGIQQNPVMGSEDPYNPSHFQSLLGVVEWPNFPCTPLEVESTAEERLDRSQLPADVQGVTKVKVPRAVPEKKPGVVDGGDAHFDGR